MKKANAEKALLRLGKRIRQLRHERGLSQEELAARAELHVTYLSALECGKRNASLAIFFAVVTALNVSPTDMFGGEITSTVMTSRREAKHARPGH
jgi:transcriptional regulator with XRE-family HTH domain